MNETSSSTLSSPTLFASLSANQSYEYSTANNVSYLANNDYSLNFTATLQTLKNSAPYFLDKFATISEDNHTAVDPTNVFTSTFTELLLPTGNTTEIQIDSSTLSATDLLTSVTSADNVSNIYSTEYSSYDVSTTLQSTISLLVSSSEFVSTETLAQSSTTNFVQSSSSDIVTTPSSYVSTSAATSPSLHSPTHDNIGAIVGITIALTFCLLCFIGIVLFAWRRKLGPFRKLPIDSPEEPELPEYPSVTRPRALKLADFEACVVEKHKDSNMQFCEEFKLLKQVQKKYPCAQAELPVNQPKNRFIDILPYDKTRVKLMAADCEEGSDYINANYLRGFNSQREYIATQGPTRTTIDDFWRMVWEQHVSIIVMLTKLEERGKPKCECYWPVDQIPVYYGDLQLQLEDIEQMGFFAIRNIAVSLGERKRNVLHFFYENWPDFGCPKSPEELNNLVLAVRAHMPHKGDTVGPVVVHCSAGVGRTGAFVTVDRVMQQLREFGEIDIFNTVLDLRECRCNMVQTEEQYAFVHDCIVEDVKKLLTVSNPMYANTSGEPIYTNTIIEEEDSLYVNTIV